MRKQEKICLHSQALESSQAMSDLWRDTDERNLVRSHRPPGGAASLAETAAGAQHKASGLLQTQWVDSLKKDPMGINTAMCD